MYKARMVEWSEKGKTDFAIRIMRDLLKRYAKLALGKPFSPGLLNILVTSVCDMRCTHCFFTEQLDDAPRKKLQMSTREIEMISETLGGNLGVLILAGGEPFTRKDLPEIARAFYTNNKLESIYITSNGQIQKRILGLERNWICHQDFVSNLGDTREKSEFRK